MPLQSKFSPIEEEEVKRNYGLTHKERKLLKAIKTLKKRQKAKKNKEYISGQTPSSGTHKRARDQRVEDIKLVPVPIKIPRKSVDNACTLDLYNPWRKAIK